VRDLKRDIFAARVAADGTVNFLVQVNEEPTPNVHSEAYGPGAFAEKDGGWVVTYSDTRTGSSSMAYGRRLSESGGLGPEKSFGYGASPAAAATRDGGMLVGDSLFWRNVLAAGSAGASPRLLLGVGKLP
jgi:hypothetical protein